MRIADSKQLKELASILGKTAKQVSEMIISELLTQKIIEDTPENYGIAIRELVDGILVSEFNHVLHNCKIIPKSIYVEYFLDLVIIGDADCPKCGYQMIVTDGGYKQTVSNYNEPEYTTIWEEKICTNCGYKEIK